MMPMHPAITSCHFRKPWPAVLNSGDVFYDIGANVGFFTVIGARLVGPGGPVYAFEPVPENAAYVRLNARMNHFQNVVSDRRRQSRLLQVKVELSLAAYSGGAALTTAAKPPDQPESIDVELVSVDDLVFTRRSFVHLRSLKSTSKAPSWMY